MRRGLGRSEGRPVPGRRPARLRWPYLILAALMVLFAYAFIQKTREVRRLAAQEAALYNANQQTAADNVQVQRAIRYYKTSAYIEEEARVTLGYTRPGEVAVMSTPRYRPVVHAPPLVPRVQTPPEPTWKQWWRSFFR